ncbi:MAG: hypothetical protein P8101_14530, partial [Candidatus Thiodiazotropha sp.]
MLIRSVMTALAMLLLIPAGRAEATIVEFETAEFTQQVKTSSAQRLDLDWPNILRLYAGVDGAAIWHDGDSLNEHGHL